MIRLFVSSESLEEVRDVLSRPGVRRKNPEITDERRDALLRVLEERAVVIEEVTRQFQYARDPDDEPILNLAFQSQAEYLVTWDRDLLDLMTESSPEGQAIRQHCPHLKILNPPAFLRALRDTNQESD